MENGRSLEKLKETLPIKIGIREGIYKNRGNLWTNEE